MQPMHKIKKRKSRGTNPMQNWDRTPPCRVIFWHVSMPYFFCVENLTERESSQVVNQNK